MWDNELVVWTEMLLSSRLWRLAEIVSCGCIHQIDRVDLVGQRAELGLLRKLAVEVHNPPAGPGEEPKEGAPRLHFEGEAWRFYDLRPLSFDEAITFWRGQEVHLRPQNPQ
jgi:hypothetical protein